MKYVKLSDSEYEVMEILWEKSEPIAFRELLDYFENNTGKNWKKQTINTFLVRLQHKGMLKAIENGKYKEYVPVITKEEYKMVETKEVLDRNYQGSIVNMLSAFNGGEQLGEDEIADLKQLLISWEKE